MTGLLLASGVKPAPLELLRLADAHASTRSLRNPTTHRRVRPGVYAARSAWDELAPWDRYLARVHAYALINPDAVFSDESAAALLGLPVFGEPRHLHLFDAKGSGARRYGDVVVHESVEAPDIETRGGLSVTSAARTAVTLMRRLAPPFALAVGDAVISPRQGGTATVDDLRRMTATQTDTRGIRQLRLLLETIDPRSESVGESIGRAVIVWSGFETPLLQVEVVTDGIRDRVDYGWPGAGVLAESDGYGKYRLGTTEDSVRALIQEKQREDRLRRRCRAFGRWDMAASIAVEPVVQELLRLGVPRITAPRWALLSGMRASGSGWRR
ncbi:hypothetical protein QSU92_11545 [Microbacterium sp. ET2]|uniref:hypothetical protein n=1 Tax=Microbacterium albipurpureum TaxID=3050384 RepID=UPI00259C868C|nr:hypothetical protein [Microbacterium sp. ET2 (Ac-2212)]WJL94601.1 hypothetical protein QSU92_11545 [Microbacterium sp. ET2 (Ac-2212)]